MDALDLGHFVRYYKDFVLELDQLVGPRLQHVFGLGYELLEVLVPLFVVFLKQISFLVKGLDSPIVAQSLLHVGGDSFDHIVDALKPLLVTHIDVA